MIFYGAATPTTVPGVQLMGARTELGYADGVKKLQQSLIALAAQTGDPKFHPGAADGIIGSKTRLATAYAIVKISGSLSSSLKYATYPIAIVAVSGSDRVDSLISSQSLTLAAAIAAYNIKLATATAPPPASDLPVELAPGGSGSAGPAWYTTTNGKIGLGIGAAILLLLVLKK